MKRTPLWQYGDYANLRGGVRKKHVLQLLPILGAVIEDGPLTPMGLARAGLPKESALGGLARDVWHLVTPCRPRPPIQMLLEALALSQSEVFFIQVGSNDAMLGDPLRPFLLQYDWSGLMIEPVPYVFERLRRNYWHKPKLIQENVAIGPQDGWARFYCVAEAGPHEPLPKIYDQLGSFSKAHILKHAKYIPTLERRIVELTVPTMTFESLCRKHGVSRIDLLHVDAEGYDYELLKLVDFAAHRPTVLLYEHRHLSDADRVACRAKLEADGYALIEHGADTLGLHHAARAKPLSRLARAWRVIERQPPTTDIASGGPEGLPAV